MTEDFVFQLVMLGELLALVALAVQPDKPSNECSSCGGAVRGLVVVDQLALGPGRDDLLKF